ncbi:MAG: rRNA maturation factor [Chloroflexi bacterium]|nr:rRNA maturation factor [Chloroflexota bacterium]
MTEADGRPRRRPRRRTPTPLSGDLFTPVTVSAEPVDSLPAPDPIPVEVVAGVSALGTGESDARPPSRRRGGRGRSRKPVVDGPLVQPSAVATPMLEIWAVTDEPPTTSPQTDAPPLTDEAVAPTEAAPTPRRRSARATEAASPVGVNVSVPRGLGRKVNSKLIERVVRRAIEREGWDQPASLDVLIVGEDEMREINATRRGIDEATDVLSFPLLDLRPRKGLSEDFFVLPPEETLHLGDVLITFTRVESQALEGGHSVERELAFLTVHGVLHILGYDHETESERREMRHREEDVLADLGLRRNGA